MNDQLTILKDLKIQLLEKDSELIKEVILFGSQVHGNATNDSDYDILIIVQRKGTHFRRLLQYRFKICYPY